MEVHNLTNESEAKRCEEFIQGDRVGGVLQNTRVIGNRELKDSLPQQADLDPLVDSDRHRIGNRDWFAIVLGTDGCFRESFQTYMILREV